MSSSDLIDAKLEEHRMGGSKQCPSCGHTLDRKQDWVGLPAGVKFDPTDQELIEHLEAKVNSEHTQSHPLIDEFIPTLEGEDGICYTHPERLPGVRRDGRSKHFFHRPSKAYTTGTRKRRKIQAAEGDDVRRRGGETRWHKTGKTRPVTAGGRQRGCKKILVLYTNFGKHRKPEKTNWVMHQYHLGELEEERDGELVVSKIFFQTQPRQSSWSSGAKEPAVGLGSDHQLQHEDDFSFAPFRKPFDEVGMGSEVQPTKAIATPAHDDQLDPRLTSHHHHHHHHHSQQQQAAATAAFHIGRPPDTISAIISPAPVHQSSMVLEDPFNVSRLLLQQPDKFQQQQQQQVQQHQHKLVERSSAGLEDLVMGCTSTSNRGQEASIPHPQEAEWLKYSYWSPDNPDHHG